LIVSTPLGSGDCVERCVHIVVIQPLPVLGDALKAHPEALSHSAAGDVVGGRLEYEASRNSLLMSCWLFGRKGYEAEKRLETTWTSRN